MRTVLCIITMFVFVSGQAQITPDTAKRKHPKVLIVINGIELKNKGTQQLDSMISPDQIQSMNMLSGQTAIDKYGDRGKDGVIEIITKKPNVKITDLRIEEVQANNDSDIIFHKVEIEPSFKGGERPYLKFLEKNLDANVPVENGAPEGTYTIVLQFIVDKDGAISEVKALTNHGFGMEEEAIRLIKLSPKWEPGIQNGKIVKSYKKLPITFVISSE